MAFLLKKKYAEQHPNVWVMNPNSHPKVLYSLRIIKNTLIRYTDKNKRIFLVTSAESKVGVSTIAFNLSLTCGWDIPEYRILLIDANISSPSLYKSFDIKKSPGLVDYLYSKVSLKDIIYKSCLNNFELVPIGEKYDYLPSPFTRLIFIEFIEYIKNQYDIIIIDSEPLLNSSYTQSILPIIDGGVIIVAEAGKTRFEDMKKIHLQFQSYNVNIIGTIFNKHKNIIPKFIQRYL